MADLAWNKTTENECNMSRVSIEQKLEGACWNRTSTQPSACDPSAHGISLSTPIIMTTIGVLGNILALIVLYASRREAQARRTVFFVMLSGLAWTDLIGLISVSPIAIITYANNLTWVGGAPLCRYHGFMMVSFGVVMPLVVCCMSVERFLAIKFSYYYARHITRRKAQMIFLACWAVTISFASLPFIGFGSYELQFPHSWCFLNFHRESTVDTVYAAMFSSLNIIAIVIMILCNLVVAATLFRVRLRRRLHSSPSIDRRLSVTGISSSTSGTIIRQRHHSDMEAQMIWFLCLITVAFSVCWLPLNVHILIMQFTGTTNQVLDLTFIRMVSCNQILDPWLYVIFRKNSVLRIIRQVKACCCGIQEPAKMSQVKPSMRYNISNRSFVCEPTTVARTCVGEHHGNKFPLLCGHSMKNCDENRKFNCNGNGTGVATRRLSSCPSCNSECCSENCSHPASSSPHRLSLPVLHLNSSNCSLSANLHDRNICRHSQRTQDKESQSTSSAGLSFAAGSPHTTENKRIGDDMCESKVNGHSFSPYPGYCTPTISINNVYTQQESLKFPTDTSPLCETMNSSQGTFLSLPLNKMRLRSDKQSSDQYSLLSPPLASPEKILDTPSQTNSQENLSTNCELTNSSAMSVCIPSTEDCDSVLRTKGPIRSYVENKCNEASVEPVILSPELMMSTCRHVNKNEKVTNDETTSSYSKVKSSLTDKSVKKSPLEHHQQKPSDTTADFEKDDPRSLAVPVPRTVKSVRFPSGPLEKSDRMNKSQQGSCLDLQVEDKLDTSLRLLQGTDHRDQHKFLKAKRTPFLGRNGAVCHWIGVSMHFNDCVGGAREQSIGNHT